DGDRWHVFGRDLRVSEPDKVLFPGQPRPVTKRELLRYTTIMAPTVLPHVAGRALTLRRFPGGAGTKGSWQRRPPRYAPRWLTDLTVAEPAALVWAAAVDA